MAAGDSIAAALISNPLPPIVASPSLFTAPTSFQMPDIQKMVKINLDLNNYLLWQSVFLNALRAHNVEGHVSGATPAPPEFRPGENGSLSLNPAYVQWRQLDTMVLTWINSTITVEIFQHVYDPLGVATARQTWDSITLFLLIKRQPVRCSNNWIFKIFAKMISPCLIIFRKEKGFATLSMLLDIQ